MIVAADCSILSAASSSYVSLLLHRTKVMLKVQKVHFLSRVRLGRETGLNCSEEAFLIVGPWVKKGNDQEASQPCPYGRWRDEACRKVSKRN